MNWKRKTHLGSVILLALIMVYVALYSILRLTHVLVARSYLVFLYDGFGGQTMIEHFDVGRGSAYGPNNELKCRSFLEAALNPVAEIELHLRGKGLYPITWPKASMMEEEADIKPIAPPPLTLAEPDGRP